jgi:hypothetical protein
MANSNYYSPPNNNDPQLLPERWKFDDGTVRTDLQSLSDAELNELGWSGPHTMPDPTEYFTHSFLWNKETLSYDSTELTDEEKRRGIFYYKFWDLFENTEIYGIIKADSKTSLSVNSDFTEFMTLITDGKMNNPNETMIQSCLNELLESITYTTAQFEEFETAFRTAGMHAVYTLPSS